MLTGLNRARMKARPPASAGKSAPPAAAADAVHGPADGGGITDALSAIPLEDREALLLVVIAGLSYAEAGDAVGVPRHVVAQRIARARVALEANFYRMPGSDPRGRAKHMSHLRLVK
jgi:RNA polymerase sigma-70 factor (ECF subfamily)